MACSMTLEGLKILANHEMNNHHDDYDYVGIKCNFFTSCCEDVIAKINSQMVYAILLDEIIKKDKKLEDIIEKLDEQRVSLDNLSKPYQDLRIAIRRVLEENIIESKDEIN